MADQCRPDPLTSLEAFKVWPQAELATVDLAMSRARDESLTYFASVAGNVSEMVSSYRFAVEALHASDGTTRWVALRILTDWWDLTSEVATYSLKLALDDPDERVRLSAIHYVGFYYQGSRDDQIAYFLSNVVRNKTETPTLRAAAYQALATLREFTIATVLGTSALVGISVDWEFVNAVYESHGAAIRSVLAKEGAPPAREGRAMR
jgi:hypothetical protein